jgi:transcriptional antiterminator NusG
VTEQRIYKIGEFVELVDLSRFGPLEVPIPRLWYILRVHQHREFKVMKTFRQRNISAWLPLLTSMQDVTRYRRGFEYVQRRNVTSPMISGVIIMPDFEIAADRWCDVDGVIGVYRMHECTPFLTPKDVEDLRNIEAIANTPRSKRARAFEVGQLVRVVNGPFREFCGSVERLDSRTRLTIGVKIFGRITPSEFSESDIEAV